MTGQVLTNVDVSRETILDLETYVGLLKKWNVKINLISRSTESDIWTRHIADSVQVFDLHTHTKEDPKWFDLGSGGGLPGLVCAILAKNTALNSTHFTLVESDARKSVFLKTVARELGLNNISVINDRIENVTGQQPADIISARALADLTRLIELTEHLSSPNTVFLFPKGRTWEKEVEDAQNKWKFESNLIKSCTASEAVVLKIKGVRRV